MNSQEKNKVILNEEEVRTILKNHLGNEEFQLEEFSIKPASENPLGFLGEHYKLAVNVRRAGHIQILYYFVKRIPTEVPEHADYALNTRAFYKEIELYKTLFADLKNAQSDLKERTKWCPEYYYSRATDLFVLEDLSQDDYYMYPERELLDKKHVMISVKVMAAMHAASFVFEEKFNRGEATSLSNIRSNVTKKKISLGELYSHLTFETEASDVKGHPGNTFYEAGIPSQLKIVELLSHYSAEEKKQICKKLPAVLRHSFQLVKPSNRYKNVFIHGDLWANNMLFRKNKDGEVVDARIIDFQIARYAPPAHDLMMFLYLVQDDQFINEHEKEIFKYYYEALDEELKKNSLGAKTLLPWETFLESCEFYRDLGLISRVFFFQLTLAPPEVTSQFLSSPDSYIQNMLVDRSQMVLQCFLKSETVRKRVTEALNGVIKRYSLTANTELQV